MNRNDKTGWQRGAGPYSKNYAKFEKPPEYVAYHNAGQANHHKGKELQVDPLKVNFGLSGALPKMGNRPAHKAGKRSYKRV